MSDNVPGRAGETPDISVIVPTHNRPDRLEVCLDALARQTLPHDHFEVVIIDDGGNASLEETVAPRRARLDIRLIRQENAGPARARNAGAAQARGPLLAFTDDDCEPLEGWLKAVSGHLAAHPDDVIGGHTVNALPDNPYSAASQLLIDYLYEYYGRLAEAGVAPAAPPFFTSNNLAMQRRIFQDVGGFDESFPLAAGEDRELCDRLQQHGYRLRYAPDAVIRHGHALTFSRFWRQHLNYGRGAVNLRRARAAKGLPEVRIEPPNFYRGLVTSPFRIAAAGHSRLRLLLLLLISQIANVVGFELERLKRRKTPAPLP